MTALRFPTKQIAPSPPPLLFFSERGEAEPGRQGEKHFLNNPPPPPTNPLPLGDGKRGHRDGTEVAGKQAQAKRKKKKNSCSHCHGDESKEEGEEGGGWG